LASFPEKEMTLRDLLSIYRRRNKVIYATLLSFALLGGLYCTFSTRRYEATGTIQIQKEGADAMDLSDLMGSAGGASDALSANIDLQTQANILQSDTLALHTIESLNMEATRDFQPRWNPITWALSLVSPAGIKDAPGATLENAPERRRRVLKIFNGELKVTPVSGTRLVEIHYLSSDPKMAAAVVNSLMQGLTDYAFQTRFNATNQASAWLGGQLSELRKDSEDLQAKVVQLNKESGVYSLGMTDAQGREEAYSGVLDRLQQATQSLGLAEQNVILKGAIAHAAQAGDAEMLSGLAGNVVGQISSVNNSLVLIQNLRQQEATQAATLQQMESMYGANYPQVIEQRGNVAALDRSIREEINRIKGRAESDYEIAKQTVAGVSQRYEEAKKQADTLNDKAIQFTIVSQEAQESRSLYEDLLKRLKEAGILEGLKSSNITVVDPGRVPSKPSKPNVPLYMVIALAGGFLLGCCGALVVDTLDNKISGFADMEQALGQPVLGVLPFAGELHKISEKPLKKTQSVYIEAMRALRTSLMLWQSNAPPKVLLVTSSIAGEGKSTTSIHLAGVLAQYGHRVLLVDADLRRGTLRTRLNLARGQGLSAMVSGQWSGAAIPHFEGLANLDVLQAGQAPPNPSELLGSAAMRACLEKWRTEYDFVVLDGPPVLPVTDGVLLNAQVDATLLVARAGMTEKPQLKRSFRMLNRDGGHLVGVVLNGLRPQDESYYGYYGYHRYDNTYAEGSDV
jgi:polysaccharide biosynthesis transport protein